MIASSRPEHPGLLRPDNHAVAWLAPLLIGFAAAAYGGVGPGSELVLVIAAGALLAYAAVRASRLANGWNLRAAVGLVTLYGALALFQAAPLPESVVAVLSPERAAMVERLSGEAPAWSTLSYNATETLHAARMVLLGGFVLLAVGLAVRTTASAAALLTGLFGMGVAESALAIAQQATDAQGVYWSDYVSGATASGSFINHSNFAQFLNLTLGASLGLLLIRLSEDRHGPDRARRYGNSASALFRRHGWLFIGIALQAVAIAASLSRAGLVAMGIASAGVFLLLAWRSELKKATWTLTAVPVAVFAGLLLLPFDSVIGRVETLQEHTSYEDRVELGLATIRVGIDHPLFGAGLGAHAYVFPSYDTTGSVAFAEQADNDYAQIIEETGLVGVLLIAAFIGVMTNAVWRCSARQNGPLRYAAYGIAYGLVAVAIQSVTDFGQRVPAVFCANAALCGLALSLASDKRKSLVEKASPPRVRTLFVASALVVVWVAGVASSVRDYRAERWWAVAYGAEDRIREAERARDVEVDPLDYIDLLSATEAAAKTHPRKVEYAFWLNAYRWQAFIEAAQGGNPLATEAGRETARKIADALHEVRRLCPTYGPTHTLEGQIRLAIGDQQGAELIQQGVELAPNDPMACFVAAGLTLSQPADEAADRVAYELIQRAVGLNPSLYSEATEALLAARGEVELATELADGDPSRLRHLAGLLESLGGYDEAARRLLAEADAAQLAKVESGQFSPGDAADLARRATAAGNLDEAAQLYRKALAARFNEVRWRLELVEVLVRLDRVEEAYREARICLRLRPGSAAARRWVEELIDKRPSEKTTPDEEVRAAE